MSEKSEAWPGAKATVSIASKARVIYMLLVLMIIEYTSDSEWHSQCFLAYILTYIVVTELLYLAKYKSVTRVTFQPYC